MAYNFIDGYGSVLAADSSIVSGSGVTGLIRPIVHIGSVLGAIPTTFSGSPSISGAVTIVGAPSVYGNISGSVVAFQGGAWTTSVVGNVGLTGTPSISGAVTVIGNPSISGQVGASIIGAVNINPASVQVLNPVSMLAVTQSGAWTPSVSGTVGASIIGTVPIVQSGTMITSLVSTVPSSVLVGASIIGLVPIVGSVSGSVGIVGNPSISGTVLVNNGSVVAFQGGAWTTSVVGNVGQVGTKISSISGVVEINSIVGTYAEDVGHTTADKGLFILGVRNDEMPSITSANLDYSPVIVDPTGAMIVHDAPITKWVQGTADLRVVLGASVTAIPAQGASIFTYIREVQVANMGSASVLVTFGGGLGSILGYTIAPAGGGSNFITRLKTGENSAFTASISGTASVLVAVQGFISKT